MPGVNRANRLSCSASCRQRGHRLRVKRAQELHAQGMTPREIAKVIGSGVKSVKHWIARRKEK
jgi:transposase